MNSWHSFSPNGRWLVFSSKSRSPYTQMYLTHLDAEGRDSPAILIENATAANRAVNLPEFVNIPADTPLKIEVPAADFYRLFDIAWDLAHKGQYEAAAAAWKNALQLSPDDARAHYNLGIALAQSGRFEEAVLHYRQALRANPEFGEVHNNLAVALARAGQLDEAIAHYRKALEYNPDVADVQTNFGVALIWKGKPDAAIACFQQALKIDATSAEAHRNLGNAFYYFRGRNRDALAEWEKTLRVAPNNLVALNQAAWLLATCPDATLRNGRRAVILSEHAGQLSERLDSLILDTQAAAYAEVGRFPEAIRTARRAVAAASRENPSLVPVLKKRLALYESGVPFRESVPPSR
jgi:tetratricopeptide (TPR) repeat protein